MLLAPVLLRAQTVSVVSLTPASGAGASQIFSFTFSDSAGASRLTVSALIGSSTAPANSCEVTYNVGQNALALLTDSGAAPSGTISPGLSSQSNSQCTLYGSVSTASVFGNSLTLNLAIGFNSAYAGSRNVYGRAQDAFGADSGWQQLGSWNVVVQNQPPQVISVQPSSGAGYNQTLTFTYSDANGALDLSSAQVIVNASASGVSSCYIWVAPPIGAIWIASDDYSTWPGPLTLGQAGTLSNSQCSVNVGASSGVLTGSTYTLNLALTFQPAFAGQKNVYSYATSLGGLNSGAWQQLGTWTVGQAPPRAVSVAPAAGGGASQSFTFVYSDSNGASDLKSAQAIFNSTLQAAGGCYVWADPVHALVWLDNDTDTAWSSSLTLGTAGTLSNSQCSVNVGASSGVLTGNTYTLNLALTFQPGFAGARNVYGYASQTTGNLNPGWQPLGTWTTTTVSPVVVTPASGAGASQVFSFTFSDSAGAADLSTVSALIGSSTASANSCEVTYNVGQNALALLTNSGAPPSGTISPGHSSQSNSQCTLYGSVSTASVSGNILTLSLAIGFNAAYAGPRNVYGRAQNVAGADSGWWQLGSWNVVVQNQPPQVISVQPFAGTGYTQTFTFTYSDVNGASDLSSAQVIVNASASGVSSCYIWVAPPIGAIWIASDDYSSWPGPLTLGQAGTLSNSQCSVNVGASSGVLTGSTYTLNLALTFQPAFAGQKNVYSYATSLGGLNSGAWQQLGAWTVPLPAPVGVTLTAPANGAVSQPANLTLSWVAAAGATSYDVYLGTGTPSLAANVSATFYTPSPALASGSAYAWYVIGRNASSSGPTSSTWTFWTVSALPPAVTLSYPATGSANQSLTPTLTWNAAAGANSYDVYMGAGTPAFAGNTGGTSFTPSATLASSTTYSWYVVAKSAGGSAPASATWTFSTVPPPPPAVALAAPVNGAASQPTTPSVTWTAAPGATSYDVYLGSGTPTLAATVTTTTYTPNPALTGNTVYSWYVIAKNVGGSAPPSPTWTFTTDVPDFTMTLGSGPTPWLAGMTGTFTFTLSSTNALPGSITFTYAQLPAGASISLNPSSVTLGPSSTATVTATIATLPTDNGGVAGNFSPVITATAGPAAHSLTVPVLLQDFGLTLSKQRQDVPCAGGALTLELSSPGVNGYDTTNQPVTLSFYGFFVTPIAVPGTGLSLGSASIVQDTNTLVVSVSVGPQYCGTEQIYYAALRGYSGGYSGGVNHYAWAEVHINSPSAHQADFTVAVSPPSQTLATPGLTAYPISVSAAWGFGSPVNLVVSGAPAGATAYFAQSGTGQVSFNIVGGSPGRPTLVVTTTASTPAGTYPLTITASGGGVAHTATATLVVGQSTAQSYIVSASQPGFSITLDDTGYTTPQTRQWQSGEQHTVSALSTQNDGSGNPYDFSDWSDGGAQTHSVIGGTAQPAITARYSPRVPLPSPISVVPYFGTGSAQTFTATYTDPHGASAITQALLSIQATAGITASQCIMRYDPGPGNLYLKADDGVALLGPIAAGGLDTLSNSQCVLSGGSNGTASGNNLSVNFAVIFTTSFTGTKQLILQALEASVAGRAVPLGTWTVPVPGSGPTTGVTGGTPPGPDDSSPTPTATPPSVQTNSAPNCNDITGTWTDPFGDVYSLRQTGSSVTGTISEPDPYCLYNVIWQVQG